MMFLVQEYCLFFVGGGMMKQHISVLIPAYNEENTLPRCIASLESVIQYTRAQYGSEVTITPIICVNGCTDNTLELAKKLEQEKRAGIRVIQSQERGMVKAEIHSLNYTKENYPPGIVVFLDADSVMNKDVFQIFIDQYQKHPELKMVGAHPLPITPNDISLHDQLLHQIMNFRAYFPKSQVAINDVSAYHPFASSDPQPIGPDFEKKAKIMIHGRCFSIRDHTVWDVPPDAIGEDLWLNLSVNTRFGPGSSRLMYNANVKFWPIDDFGHYIKVYARIHKDLVKTVSEHPEFSKVAKDEDTLLSDEFLVLTPIQRLAFEICKTLETKTKEQFSQGIYTASNIDELWNYDSKKVVE
jgi:glycosyltransferase involved in cell wall biosynthesis